MRRPGRDLTEQIAPERSPLKVDRDKGIIYGVKVLGKYSRNTHNEPGVTGAEYSDGAMKQACELYEGIIVRLNHPDRKSPNAARDVRESIGKLCDCRIEGDCVRADLHYNRKHPFADELLEDVERGLGAYGLSHNARAGRESVRNGRLVIEELELVRSVDLVDKPATNRNLWESLPVKKTKKAPEAGREVAEDDVYTDAPVDTGAADQSPDAALKAGFRAAILAVLDDDTMDVKTQLKKIGELLKTEEKLLGGGDSADDSETVTESEDAAKKDGMDGDDEDRDRKESYQERLDQLERKDAARDLCESIGFIPTKDQLGDLCAIADEAARKRVAEAYKAQAKPAAPAKTGHGGPRSQGRNVSESQTTKNGDRKITTAKGWLNRMR